MFETIMRTPLRGIALDVDGTIADTDPIHGEAWARALKTVNNRTFSVASYIDACITGAMTPLDFVAEFSEPEELRVVEAEKRRIYPGLLSERARLTAGLERLLDQAADAQLKVAIVSSSSRESVDALLAGLWRADSPTVIVARGDALRPKPQPAPYLRALERLDLNNGEVVAFEDSTSGIASAVAAGLFCVKVGGSDKGAANALVQDFRSCSIDHDWTSSSQPRLVIDTR